MRVCEHANRIIDLSDNLRSEEMPPDWVWAFDEELKVHFEQVQRTRESEYSSDQDVDAPDMEYNELADEMRR